MAEFCRKFKEEGEKSYVGGNTLHGVGVGVERVRVRGTPQGQF